jgi:general secretion pathway protein D
VLTGREQEWVVFMFISRVLFSSLCIILLVNSGCGTKSKNLYEDALTGLQNSGPVRRKGSPRTETVGGGGARSSFAGTVSRGTGSFVSAGKASITPAQTYKGGDGYTLNLMNVPIRDAAKNILGDTLGLNYFVDDNVNGTITVQTSAPVSKDALTDIFESALLVAGAAIVERDGVFQIVPADFALEGTPPVSVPGATSGRPGIKVQVIELRHISAGEMNNILEPISRAGSILRIDEKRNLMIIAGTSADLAAIREAISVFDVDWMRGMSVALYPLEASQPEEIAKELDEIFSGGGEKTKVIRFIPNERLKAILVITSNPSYLTRARNWIQKLDVQARYNEEQLFVYHIQNRPAKELADILRKVLLQEHGYASADAVSPELTPIEVASEGRGNVAGGEAINRMVVADVENNALLISSTPAEYERIRHILSELDILPTQVLLEAVIAEVTLNDELKLGLRWFFEEGDSKFTFSDLVSGAVGSAFPGFSWSYATNNIEVTLNALQAITDVNVVSSPTLMTRNNQEAMLQIGDQVPILTQQAVDAINPDVVVNAVEMRDTGVILKVTPRVNRSGRVMLDIDQEVSTVIKTETSGIDSPTIRQRKITTKVTVHDGENLALGGLIEETNSANRSQVPLLGSIPLLGNAFRYKEDKIKRTELIIFIRPRIVRSVEEARSVTEEFRNQLNLESPLSKSRRGRNDTERDINRLVY